MFLSVISIAALLTGYREATRPPAAPPQAPVQSAGEEVCVQSCASCSGPDTEGSALGPRLVSAQVTAWHQVSLKETNAYGKPGTSMRAWDGVLGSRKSRT